MINWKIVVLKTLILFIASILLLFLNVLIFFLTFGSGEESTRIGEIWYVDFLFNYLPLLLTSTYLLFTILKSKKDIKSNFIVLFLLTMLYLFRDEILNLVIF